MKKQLFICMTAVSLAWMAPSVLAQSTNTTSEAPAASRQAAQAHRQELLRILGLTREDFKGLSPEERRTKMKDATTAKIAELQKKKDAGTITPQETKDLTFLQNQTAHHAKKPAQNQ